MGWKIVVIALAVAILVGCVLFMRSDTKGSEARALVAQGARLIDVRSPEEFAAGHIEGAVNIPVGELSGRIAEVGDKDRAVIVYCHTGMRSSRAQSKLRQAGFTRVHNLGGMSNW